MKVQNRKCFVTKYSITGTGSGFHNLEEKKQKALETLPLSSYFVCSLRCLGRWAGSDDDKRDCCHCIVFIVTLFNNGASPKCCHICPTKRRNSI